MSEETKMTIKELYEWALQNGYEDLTMGIEPTPHCSWIGIESAWVEERPDGAEGYPEFSDAWHKCNTECDWCRDTDKAESENKNENHISLAVIDGCKNLEDSFGDICVRCNECGRFDEVESEDKEWGIS